MKGKYGSEGIHIHVNLLHSGSHNMAINALLNERNSSLFFFIGDWLLLHVFPHLEQLQKGIQKETLCRRGPFR